MTEIVRKFRCRINEFVTIGTFIFNSFTRDKVLFTVFTDFEDPFETNFKAALDNVNVLVFPQTFTLEMKKITFRMYNNVFALRKQMNRLETFVRQAGDALTVLPKDFGISQVRKQIGKLEIEGLDEALKLVEANIVNNFLVLKDKGFTDLMQTELTNAHTTIIADNTLQNTKLSDRDNLVEGNTVLLNDVWVTYINNVAAAGKNIMKTESPAKTNDYTISYLVNQIRQEQEKTNLSGKTKNGSGVALAGVDILLKPISGGKTYKTKSDVNGNYELKGMHPDSYNLIATLNGVSSITQVDIARGERKKLDVVV
jgi:Carboxypeptidase regulatory-like domain